MDFIDPADHKAPPREEIIKAIEEVGPMTPKKVSDFQNVLAADHEEFLKENKLEGLALIALIDLAINKTLKEPLITNKKVESEEKLELSLQDYIDAIKKLAKKGLHAERINEFISFIKKTGINFLYEYGEDGTKSFQQVRSTIKGIYSSEAQENIPKMLGGNFSSFLAQTIKIAEGYYQSDQWYREDARTHTQVHYNILSERVEAIKKLSELIPDKESHLSEVIKKLNEMTERIIKQNDIPTEEMPKNDRLPELHVLAILRQDFIQFAEGVNFGLAEDGNAKDIESLDVILGLFKENDLSEITFDAGNYHDAPDEDVQNNIINLVSKIDDQIEASTGNKVCDKIKTKIKKSLFGIRKIIDSNDSQNEKDKSKKFRFLKEGVKYSNSLISGISLGVKARS